jgi:hypothetical protein
VWQRHLTALDDGAIRETALGGPDTATRVKTIWQVKTAKVDQPKCISDAADWAKIVTPSTGHLTARAKPGEDTDTPCVLPPGAGYRRLENQLYRVEIHQPGERGKATFKWSRDNGTVVTKLAGPINGKEVKVDDLGRDAVLGFNPGDWVELLDDATDLNGVSGVLAQIDIIERATKKVVLKAVPAFAYVKERNPKMRRWDDPHGERKVELGPEENDGFLELEDGVQVKFAGGYFNTGDYWLIPARTATNGVEWHHAHLLLPRVCHRDEGGRHDHAERSARLPRPFHPAHGTGGRRGSPPAPQPPAARLGRGMRPASPLRRGPAERADRAGLRAAMRRFGSVPAATRTQFRRGRRSEETGGPA